MVINMTDVKEVCEEFCKPYHPNVSEVTTTFDYRLCLSDCKDLYDVLKEFVYVIIIRRCREDVSWRPENVKEKVFKGCVGYYIKTLIVWKDLTEKLLKMIADELISETS
jgi:hypothetical protein